MAEQTQFLESPGFPGLSADFSSNSKTARREFFRRDSQTSGNMIHAGDGGFGVASLWAEGGLRGVPGPSQGAERQYRHGRFRAVGLRHVFHAERVFPVLSADAGERARAGRTARPCSASRRSLPTIISGTCSTARIPLCSRPASSARSNCFSNPRCARRSAGSAAEPSSPSTGPNISAARRSPARIARRASAATARSKAIIPCWPRLWSRRDIPRSSRSRRSSSSNRTAPRSRIASATPSNAGSTKHGARLKPLRPVYLADDLFACQSVVERLADNGDDFIFTCKESLAQGALRLHRRRRTRAPRGQGPQGQDARDASLPVHRQGSAARRQGRRAGQLDRLRNLRRQGRRQIQDGLRHFAAGHQEPTSPRSPPAAAQGGRSRTKASTS